MPRKNKKKQTYLSYDITGDIDGTYSDLLASFSIEELRAIYTMCQDIPTPAIGSHQAVSGLKKLREVVGNRFCRKCTRASVAKDAGGHAVCKDHKKETGSTTPTTPAPTDSSNKEG